MAGSKKCFTFIWKIKNFSFLSTIIKSPSFIVHEMNGTKWRLYFNPSVERYSGLVGFYLQSEFNDTGPEDFQLDYEFSFLDGIGFVLKSEMFLKKEFGKNTIHYGHGFLASKNDILLLKKDLFIPRDILTIRCRMWDSLESITQSGKCIAQTLVETESVHFVGIVKNVNRTEPNSNYLVSFKSSSTVPFFSSMNLCVDSDGKLAIEVNFVNKKSLYIYRYIIFIRDVFGNKVKSGHGEFPDKNHLSIPLTISIEHLIENKRDYLPNDVLTIEFEVTFPTGETTEKIGEIEYGFDFQDTQEMISNAKETNLTSKEHTLDCFTTLMDDLSSLFNEGILYDTELKAENETFPAHTLILSSRSSVFKSMFSTEMKEKINNCVKIDDLDADTVRQMLLFIYSDTLNDLNYDRAKSLYFAADKYNIVSLKLRCSNFLRQNLSLSNCCEILVLAAEHEDNNLKNAVQDYILRNDEVVLSSDEWKNLEKNNSHLTNEVLRSIYMKSRNI